MQDVLTHKADSRKMEEIDELKLEGPGNQRGATSRIKIHNDKGNLSDETHMPCKWNILGIFKMELLVNKKGLKTPLEKSASSTHTGSQECTDWARHTIEVRSGPEGQPAPRCPQEPSRPLSDTHARPSSTMLSCRLHQPAAFMLWSLEGH